ncbi:hypothetical protein [Anianabacter salinae]|uniref:hypothetical protein n=1 Tax=Anianabacter salinae TaxID=2851023 RepID=UPI00225E00A1|nr:hypothetical protein [Anianabacter salinae]MBV0912349.1 hypothetical protein [Anianabacter salinae]
MAARPARAAAADAIIRPYRPEDRAAVRAICCKTAFRNMGAAKLFEDEELFADFGTLYYTDQTPEEIRVVEKDGEVIGYFFGAPDHAAHLRAMRRIVPRIVLTALWRWLRGRYKRPQTMRYLRHLVLNGGKEAPRVDFALFPATYHCNITRKGAGGRYYTTMLLDYLDRLEARGITGIHGFITEPEGTGIYQRFSEQQDAVIEEWDFRSTDLFKVVLGDDRPMVNHVAGATIPEFRKFALWLRDVKGM